ncbi:MAG: branched-chain amino acid aminotransferase [Frankiales bacterium]|nr:branched-chain amino acid aminotransferase [Frankiales bacterium]
MAEPSGSAPQSALSVERSTTPTSPERRAELLSAPGFGRYYTDHMVTIEWSPGQGWHDAAVRPYAPLAFDPATSVLHYGQAIFEGFKAYRQPDGGIATFRPEANGARFQRSAARMALPELPVELFVEASDELVRLEQDWVPSDPETALYLRPFMLGTEVGLGVRPSAEALVCIIASPAGAYFAGGIKPVSLWLSEEYVRAAPGGTGAAKCAGNYAASLIAQREAGDNGCDQVVFLDAVDKKWIEELGGMNLFFVLDDGTLATPETSGTILEGITRESLITLAGDLGHKVDERRIDIDEWREGVASGRITEVFACGTAAVITPVGTLKWHDGSVTTPGDGFGPVTTALRTALLDIQYGKAADRYQWLHRVV